jgi:glycosylphosphatidylinositol phospholipase D
MEFKKNNRENALQNVTGIFTESETKPNSNQSKYNRVSSPGRAKLLAQTLFSTLVLFSSPVLAQESSSTLELSSIDGSNGLTFDVVETDSIVNVKAIGDINGDGLVDVAIGISNANPGNKPFAGITYVVFGQKGGLPSPLDVTALNGSNGFRVDGTLRNEFLGRSLSEAGDINSDGVDDFIIGTSSGAVGGPNTAGAAYVIFGKTTGFASTLSLSELDGNTGFSVMGENAKDRLGRSVSYAGDVNADGIDDIVIGAEGADPGGRNGAGTSYVVFGTANGFSQTFDLSTLDGNNGFAIHGILPSDGSGNWVKNIGDINADGADDLIIAAPLANPGGLFGAGSTYVVFGSSTGFAPALELSNLNGANGFGINGLSEGDGLGSRSGAAGDINGDGIDDLLIGGINVDVDGVPNAGVSYVLFGNEAPFGPRFPLNSLDGESGFSIVGAKEGDRAGRPVGVGDVNGDGANDILVGASGLDSNGASEAGGGYVVFGKPTGYSAKVNLASLTSNDGFTINGAAVGDGTFGEGGKGDFNGDGINDLILGGAQKRSSHIVYGVSGKTGPTTVFSSVLPAARSGFVGGPAITVFASVINAGANLADNCRLAVPNGSPFTFSYQPTNAANVSVGPSDAAFLMNPGAIQSFILSFTPTVSGAGAAVFPQASCDSGNVALIPGVNSVFLSIDNAAVPDILSISSTPDANGIITVPAANASFMSVSATNIGVGDAAGSQDAAITVSVDDGGANLPLLYQICETDAAGTCNNPPASADIVTTIGAGPSFFGVFVFDQTTGGVSLDPANKRVFLRFTDAGGTVRSVTSAAVTVP